MKKSVVFMFSGQGSQYYNMGKEMLVNPTFRAWMLKLDKIVHSYLGCSIMEQIYEPPNPGLHFARTLFTHPAIFMVEYALAQVLLEKGITPDCLLGTSLGELTAIALTQNMELEDAIACVLKQAEAFEAHCPESGMVAILGSPGLLDENPHLFADVELAGVNYHSHFVVSGATKQLNEIADYLKSRNILYWILPVSFAFHSRWIDAAQPEYSAFLQQKILRNSLSKPNIPLMSCLTGDFLPEIPPSFFWEVVRRPILFREAIQKLEAEKARCYVDLGPSGTLANFVKYNLDGNSKSEYHAVLTPFKRDIANLDAIIRLLYKMN